MEHSMEVNFSSKSPAAVASKRSDVVAMLEARKAERLAAKAERRAGTATLAAADGGSTNVALSSEEFWVLFNAGTKKLREDMDGFVAACAASAAPQSEAAVQGQWVAWCERASELQALVNDSSRFLAPFDQRKAQQACAALLDHADACKAACAPRKKFAFSKRCAGSVAEAAASATATATTSARATAAAAAAVATAAVTAAAAASTATVSLLQIDTASGSSASSSASSSTASAEEDEFTLEGLRDTIVVLARGAGAAASAARCRELDAAILAAGGDSSSPPSPALAVLLRQRRQAAGWASGRDLRLLRCSNCTFLLLDSLKALRGDELQGCALLTGPIAGSVLLHGCSGCAFAVLARQFRIHTSTACAFFIGAMSRPIIEHCSQLGFAPYALQLEGLGQACAAAELGSLVGRGEEGEGEKGAAAAPASEMWGKVDDFDWHRAQHSPNCGGSERSSG